MLIAKSGDFFTDFSVDMYEDTSASMSYKQIKEIKEFSPHSNRISEGYSSSHFWYKFKIRNATDSKLNYFIKFTENIAHEVDCYIVSSSGEYVKYREGVGTFSKNSLNELKKPEFIIDLNVGESKTVYLRIFGIYANFTSFNIFDAKSLDKYTLKYEKVYSLFFGTIIALLLYNLVIYFYSRDSSYLYYVLYGSSFLSWQLLLNGFPPFDTFSSTSTFYLAGISIPIMITFIIFFTRAILDTKKLFPKIDKAIKFIYYLHLVLYSLDKNL